MNAPAVSAGDSAPSEPEAPERPREPRATAHLPNQDPRVLELYKTAVEMADRVSARRATANAFFLTAQTALVAVIVITAPGLPKVSWWAALAISLAGVTLSASWWLQLTSYRDLNGAKFVVINAIEEDLPVKIFSDEWAVLQKGLGSGRKRRYIHLGTTERLIPGIFALLYALLFLGHVIR